jgi:hypothetical protein
MVQSSNRQMAQLIWSRSLATQSILARNMKRSIDGIACELETLPRIDNPSVVVTIWFGQTRYTTTGRR